MIPGWLKGLHLLGIILYVGGFLALTRLLGHAVRFPSAQSRADVVRVLKRMHLFVEWPGLGILLGTGLFMLVRDYGDKDYMKQGYFHAKLLGVAGLLVCDILLSRSLFRMKPDAPPPKAALFRILHGVAGLAMLLALLAVTVLR
jgi:uncharacterized membrane protein